jgi:S-DNA-T family DNA segregation ATPase FtsK/SpoIIIE
MESNKILIGIEFFYNQSTIGGFELLVLRDLTLNQLLEGIEAGLRKKAQSKDKDEKRLFERFDEIYTEYSKNYGSVILTSTNKGIDSGISIKDDGDKKLFTLGFITSTRILFSSDGQGKVYSLNNPDAINPAFKEIFPEYNISSRQLSIMNTEPVKIIPAPDLPEKPKLNILAMILPSMAMTLAMVLGRSLFMSGGMSTMGLIGLALTMVAVNVFVSLFNFRRQMKEHREKIDEWKEQYENYIAKTILRIEARQKADAEKLNQEYPGIQTLFDNTMVVSEKIYSRSQNDYDFMTIRLGSSDDVDTLFEIQGDKGDVIFSPTRYKWNAGDTGIDVVLFPEKVKNAKEKKLKELYDKTEDYLIDLPHDIAYKYRKMKCGNVPLLLSLRECGALGIVSRKINLANRLINSIIYELSYYHSPEDLQFIMFYKKSEEDDDKAQEIFSTDDGNSSDDILSPDNVHFQKYKYSSHFRGLFKKKSQFVFDKRNAKLMFDSLLSLIYERRAAKEMSSDDSEESAKDIDFTQVVVIIYEEYGIKEHAIANFLPKAPKTGEAYQNELGITFIFCKHYRGHLPSYCGNIIDIKNKDQMYITPRHDAEQMKTFINPVVLLSEDLIATASGSIDVIRKGDFYNRLKALSAIYYTHIAQNAKVPSYTTVFELLELDKGTFSDKLKHYWDVTRKDRQSIAKSLAVPVGKSENSIVNLDLHEKHDGPHMLVAGTTGSGKSETIISYLIALCLYYTPEEVNMLLIDMKGGGFIKRIGELPHVVGTVTDVDGDENGTGAEYMLKRFLNSLASEVKRRKILFNQLGVDSIDGYIERHKELRSMDEGLRSAELDKLKLSKLPGSLAHLVFVVDEFTELKRASAEDSDMDFIAEITTIARVGRSLGFHIILISQNIEGAITDDIRVNSKARLCLKVATRQASKEMIGNDKAAAPDMPGFGRAYLLVGTGSRFEYFQSAYSGAKSSQTLDMPFELIRAERDGDYTSFYDSAKDSVRKDNDKETQLKFMVDKIIEHFDAQVKARKMEEPHIIFNPPLPNKIVYSGQNVLAYHEKTNEWQAVHSVV